MIDCKKYSPPSCTSQIADVGGGYDNKLFCMPNTIIPK